MITSQLLIKMHALAAQGSEQKRKACINFYTDELVLKQVVF